MSADGFFLIALGVEKVNIRWVRANTGLIKLGIVGVVRVVVVLSLTQRAQRHRERYGHRGELALARRTQRNEHFN